MRKPFVLITLVLLFTASQPLFADSRILQPGSVDGKDTMVSLNSPSSNFGSDPGMWVIEKTYSTDQQQYGLLQFDIPSDLVGATINSAVFEFYVTYTFFEASNNAAVYDLLSAWDESTVTWDTKPSYDPTAFGTTSLLSNVDPNPAMSINHPYWAQIDITATFQSWVDGTLSNYGFLIKPTGTINDKFSFNTSDFSDSSLHPKITVDYTPSAVPEPGAMLLFILGIGVLKRIAVRK